MSIKGTRRKYQVVNIFEQQEMIVEAEERKNSLPTSSRRELETNVKFNKNDKLKFISHDIFILDVT